MKRRKLKKLYGNHAIYQKGGVVAFVTIKNNIKVTKRELLFISNNQVWLKIQIKNINKII